MPGLVVLVWKGRAAGSGGGGAADVRVREQRAVTLKGRRWSMSWSGKGRFD